MDSYFLDEEESSEVEKIDFSRYSRALLKRWWLIGLVALIVLIPWFFYLKSQPPVYLASARIQFRNYGDIDEKQSIIIRLTSRNFAEKVVAQLGLALRVEQKESDVFINRSQIFKEFSTTQSPVKGEYVLRFHPNKTYTLSYVDGKTERESLLKKGAVYDIIDDYCEVNGLSFKLVGDYDKLPPVINYKVLGFRKAVESFQSRIAVDWEDRGGTMMELMLTDRDPVLVAEMTNRLAEVFIQESVVHKGGSDQERLKHLTTRMEAAEVKLKESDLKLKSFKERYGVNLDADQKLKFSQKKEHEHDRGEVEEIIDTFTSLLRQRDQQILNGYDDDLHKRTVRFIMSQIAAHPAFDNYASMLVVRAKLGTLESEWQSIASGTSPDNFRAKEKLKFILQEHEQVEIIAKQKMAELNIELASANQQISKLEVQLRDLPRKLQQIEQLERDHKVLELQYEKAFNDLSVAQISDVPESQDVQIMDKALVPELPTNSDKKQKAAIGGFMAMFMGVGLVFVIEFMDKSLKTASDVKKYLRLPILGTIPQIDFENTFDFQDSEKIKKIDQQLVTHDYSPSPIGEAYRSLRTNLMFTKDAGKVNSLVLTSNEPGDGKSFTAANLTITLAQLKSNTLLIDADLRRGVLHNTFGVPKEPGFSNYLTDAVPLQRIIHKTQIPNLSMISCGSLIPNPSELLASHQMQRFMDEVRRKFELVVFDTPPLNAATDAVVVGTQVDAVVLVIRAGKTNRDLAKSKLELFSSVPAKVLGAVVNGATADMAHPGYSYYHY